MEAGSAGRAAALTITGRQVDSEGTTQETVSSCRGTVAEREGGWLFCYRTEEGDAARLFVSGSGAFMERGATRMVFDPSVPSTSCLYATPYGAIPMEISTRRIALLPGRLGVSARVSYLLRMGPDAVLDCRVTVRAEWSLTPP